MRLLILCGVAAPVLRLGLILILGWLHPSYSQTDDYISELGAPDSPYAEVMNYMGISVVGLLLMVFSVPLYRSRLQRRFSGAAAALLLLSGGAFVAVGLLPCDQPGCAMGGSPDVMQAHILAGFIGMTAQALAPFALGLGVFSRADHHGYSSTSLALGMLSMAGLVALVTGATAPGLAQKTMQFGADLWVLVSALYLLRIFEDAQPDR